MGAANARGWEDLRKEEAAVSDSIYRVTEVIGTSTESWEDATRHAVETAARTLRDLRVGEVVKLDVTVEDGRITHYRARVNISPAGTAAPSCDGGPVVPAGGASRRAPPEPGWLRAWRPSRRRRPRPIPSLVPTRPPRGCCAWSRRSSQAGS
jgi:flavin-binding protein dodecin